MKPPSIAYVLRMMGFNAKAVNSFVFIKLNNKLLIYNLGDTKYSSVKFINAVYNKKVRGSLLTKITDENGRTLAEEVGLA